jgi:hypothetical protein
MPVLTRVVLNSRNAKVGKSTCVYRTQTSCPSLCPLMGSGCYGENKAHGGQSLFDVPARNGAADYADVLALIDRMPRGGLLRLNVVGDFLDANGEPDAAYIDACNQVAAARPDVKIIAYTHAWRNLSPALFAFPVNASCEDAQDAEKALAEGWQAVMVNADVIAVASRRVLPCLAERRDGTQCVTCGLCASGKPTRPVVTFSAHGNARKRASAAVAARRAA